jgi:hypothetical protein
VCIFEHLPLNGPGILHECPEFQDGILEPGGSTHASQPSISLQCFVSNHSPCHTIGDNRYARHQDNGRQEEHRRDDDRNRVYDRDRKDYHNWNDNENRAWGQFLTENHRESHEYAKSNKKEQSKYWNWRHSHPDHDGG